MSSVSSDVSGDGSDVSGDVSYVSDVSCGWVICDMSIDVSGDVSNVSREVPNVSCDVSSFARKSGARSFE